MTTRNLLKLKSFVSKVSKQICEKLKSHVIILSMMTQILIYSTLTKLIILSVSNFKIQRL